ncbi:MAG: hypothetical protein HKM24_01995 [Gammaproteobacteria bacterium]|nr:hypothetical protein [Gammaproteobacteria bacterium]
MVKHISIEDFDKTIIGDDFTDTTVFSPEAVVQEVEQEVKAEAKHQANKVDSNDKDIDARRRIEQLREHKALNNELADIYDDFLNS